MSKYLSSFSDRISVAKGTANPNTLFLKELSEFSSKCFIATSPIHMGKTLKDVGDLNAQQKTILKIGLDISPEKNLSSEIYLPSHFQDTLTDRLFSFYTNEIQRGIPLYAIAGDKDCGTLELLKQLHYYSFFGAISREEELDIVRFLPYDKKAFPHYTSIVKFFNYGKGFFQKDGSSPSFYLFLDHITFTIFIVISDLENIYDSLSFIVQKIKTDEVVDVMLKLALSVFKQISGIVEKWLEDYPSYSVKCIGHGYGAAVAAGMILALKKNMVPHLEKLEKEGRIKAVLFGCPPIFNEAELEMVRGSIVTVVFGWDVLPSLSIRNIFSNVSGTEILKKRKDIPFYSERYVPGTVYWIKYDSDKKWKGVELILKSHTLLSTFSLHSNIAEDHDITTTYLYLTGAIMKKR